MWSDAITDDGSLSGLILEVEGSTDGVESGAGGTACVVSPLRRRDEWRWWNVQ